MLHMRKARLTTTLLQHAEGMVNQCFVTIYRRKGGPKLCYNMQKAKRTRLCYSTQKAGWAKALQYAEGRVDQGFVTVRRRQGGPRL